MPNSKKFWSLFTVVFVFYAFLQWKFPAFVHHVYHSPGIETIDRWFRIPSAMPLNFYLGEAERLFFGPLGQIISGSLFLCFCLLYGKQLTPKVFGAAVFFYLLITKSEVLFFPPYGDAVGGPFLEAVWLSRHGFDY